MTEALVITPRISIPLAELDFSFARSGGPGGQNVNKVSSKAILHFDIARSPSIPDDVRQRAIAQFASRINSEGKLVISCESSASQHKNREECIARLKQLLLQAATPPKIRKKSKPSRTSVRKRLEEKSRHSSKKAGRRGDWGGSEE
jgi:ribosome-associated protein